MLLPTQVQPKWPVAFVSLVLLWANPLAVQSTTLANSRNTNLIINEEKDPQNPDATVLKYFKKQLGSLRKWFFAHLVREQAAPVSAAEWKDAVCCSFCWWAGKEEEKSFLHAFRDILVSILVSALKKSVWLFKVILPNCQATDTLRPPYTLLLHLWDNYELKRHNKSGCMI